MDGEREGDEGVGHKNGGMSLIYIPGRVVLPPADAALMSPAKENARRGGEDARIQRCESGSSHWVPSATRGS
jgi:hypothetical protein